MASCDICNANGEYANGEYANGDNILTSRSPGKICARCYVEVKLLVRVINMHEGDKALEELSNVIMASPSKSSKGFVKVLKWVTGKIKMEAELNEKINFLSCSLVAYRDQSHTDIQVNPGKNGPPIPAHRALLATRSEIFKIMLESDKCKAAPTDTIALPDFSHEELDSFLEFLYSGTLPPEKVEKHLYSLLVAADKYEIPYLQKFCEQRILGSLNSSNALDVLEISDVCSNQTLKDTALNFIVNNMKDIVFSPIFDAFALKNPHLSVQITRASYMDVKSGTFRV